MGALKSEVNIFGTEVGLWWRGPEEGWLSLQVAREKVTDAGRPKPNITTGPQGRHWCSIHGLSVLGLSETFALLAPMDAVGQLVALIT